MQMAGPCPGHFSCWIAETDRVAKWRCCVKNVRGKSLGRSRSAYRLRPTWPAKHGGRGEEWPSAMTNPDRRLCSSPASCRRPVKIFPELAAAVAVNRGAAITTAVTAERRADGTRFAADVELPVLWSAWGAFRVPDRSHAGLGSAERRSPMAQYCLFAPAGALGVTALALFFLGLLPFLSAVPTAGRGLRCHFARLHREPRIQGRSAAGSFRAQLGVSRNELRLPGFRRRRSEIPFGCDPAFSPVSAPRLAYIYGRCLS